ncbi:unnamed protein product [Lepeophtheirus salmonis]|uniref:(salmon louse) hypothetical protein n=1 Tax=Lepeophtheirus salmonis TaxID=72036 RepID=A0A7R8CKX6_LEPSM|nr:unnamed protein product [Lepeophtheirus salmonis]CAF2852142.1 unnamed protein product [Lepeophtheirus salmonis]
MKRFCCLTFLKNKNMDEEQTDLKALCCEESSRRRDNRNQKSDPEQVLNLSQTSCFTDPLWRAVNHPPFLVLNYSLIKQKDGEFPAHSNQIHNSSLRLENRNCLSVRLHGSSSQRNSRPRQSNSLLTKTSSFKRLMSFRSSTKRDMETRTFQLNFLGQIYRKRSLHSTNSSNCQNETSNSVSQNELNQV